MHEYLKWNATPTNLSASKRRTFKQKVSHFAILGDVIYKWSYDDILLIFLELFDQQIAIYTCYDDICGGHFNGKAIAKCILKMGYYLSTMEKDYQ